MPELGARPPATDGSSSVQQLLDDARKRLVETGTRNRLVHVNRANARANVVNIVNERSDDVYRILCSGAGKAMRFQPLGRDDSGDDASDIVLAREEAETFDESRYTDNRLETRLGPDALQKRLLKIAREAQTAEQEQGVNVLYLALGFLTWFEDKSSALPREAPLVLLPVELVRNQRTSTYDLRRRDEDAITNLPLQRRLMEDFGVRLPEIEIGEGWEPSVYFAKIEDVIATQPRRRVDPDAMQLGFFSFSKLLMYLDLAVEAWPSDALQKHELTQKLLYRGFEPSEPLFGDDDRLDDRLPPEKLFHVVDADASQARVIEEVRSGRNLVVQGPPGTGKSQTIANIIAAAAKEGRTVLFVAEKMAALSVVRDRLTKVGLRDVFLELHSKSSNRKAVLAELARTLASGRATPAIPQAPTALTAARDRLNEIAAVLHRPIGDTGETPFSVLGRQARYIGMGVPAPHLPGEGLETMRRDDEAALAETLLDYGAIIDRTGPPHRHPFAGVGALDLEPVDLQRIAIDLDAAIAATTALRAGIELPLRALGAVEPPSLSAAATTIERFVQLTGLPDGDADLARSVMRATEYPHLVATLESAVAWRGQRDADAAIFIEAAFDCDPTVLRAPLAAGKGSFFARWGSAYRGAARELSGLIRERLPKSPAERLALLDRLLDLQRLRATWHADEPVLAAALGSAWQGERTDFRHALATVQWCAQARRVAPDAAPDQLVALAADADRLRAVTTAIRAAAAHAGAAIETATAWFALAPEVFPAGIDATDLADIAARLAGMRAALDRYGEWQRLCSLKRRLDAAGLETLAERLATGVLDGSAAAIELKFARAERLWRRAIANTPALKELAALDRHALAAKFATLGRNRLKDNVTAILATHLAQLPQGAQGEMGVLRGEIAKQRSHLALRQLFLRASNAIQRIKPVLLMSPISVAQFLPPGKVAFDLLVIDEASQVRPEDAIGTIARAKQIVIVGDQKQLPPTSFFDRLVADEEDADDLEEESEDLLAGAAAAGELESILSLCEARGLPSRMLQWHYRSRDPSLIRVSNSEFYDDKLILPPSPLQNDPDFGFAFTQVDGVYARGKRRDNRREGEAVVRRVADHARKTPDRSLGIVTFSAAQQNTISELLELVRRDDPVLDAFLREGQAEDLFVRNIENVQGDERDVILVSVGYGPSVPGGRLPSMSFGPVNRDGGERRLNVLFTRARLRCEVFASFDPGDIDVSRSLRNGPRLLKRYLEFAKSRILDDKVPTGELPDTPFEEDVADVIRSFGYLADPQVGSAGFRLDLGVRHPDRPGTYILAVECDGATYHAALWARERDRLRQEVLEYQGWRFLRIWSTDWFYDRAAQIERLRNALEAARVAAAGGIKVEGANRGRPPEPIDDDAPEGAPVLPASVTRRMPAYVRAHFPVRATYEPHEAPQAVLAPLARRIVEAEGPICVDEVARRIATSFGREKAGKRILAAARSALLAAAHGEAGLQCDGDFWFTAEQAADPPVRDRSNEVGATVKAEALSLLEIRAALSVAREDNAGGTDADLIRSAARLLGFQRVGADLHARFVAGLELDVAK